MFRFSGAVSDSKSWMNRALVLASWNSDLEIIGQSSAEDVDLLQTALKKMNSQNEFDAGHGGTTFRFLAIRLSRRTGRFFINAREALLKRPQKELLDFFSQVGVRAKLTDKGLEIISEGWKKPAREIRISAENSSQFISAVLLSCFKLDFPINILLPEKITSFGYLKMTFDLIKQAGVDFKIEDRLVRISELLELQDKKLKSELDISSAFSLICAGALAGDVTIENWAPNSAQPDIKFLEIFERMNISYEVDGSIFKIKQQQKFVGAEFNIGEAPDLFPVLCILASFAKTESRFYGARQLVHKESNRIEKTAELLQLAGLGFEPLKDGMIIKPILNSPSSSPFTFDPENDHRMAMAAGLLKLKEFEIDILNANVVKKSYPDFYKHIGVGP
jgi:3-phosphoshikimate 1-carboxyvinyltransferase